ncbi:MAG: hypothetical protein ACC645_25825 [Pirellulales bacterium]
MDGVKPTVLAKGGLGSLSGTHGQFRCTFLPSASSVDIIGLRERVHLHDWQLFSGAENFVGPHIEAAKGYVMDSWLIFNGWFVFIAAYVLIGSITSVRLKSE